MRSTDWSQSSAANSYQPKPRERRSVSKASTNASKSNAARSDIPLRYEDSPDAGRSNAGRLMARNVGADRWPARPGYRTARMDGDRPLGVRQAVFRGPRRDHAAGDRAVPRRRGRTAAVGRLATAVPPGSSRGPACPGHRDARRRRRGHAVRRGFAGAAVRAAVLGLGIAGRCTSSSSSEIWWTLLACDRPNATASWVVIAGPRKAATCSPA